MSNQTHILTCDTTNPKQKSPTHLRGASHFFGRWQLASGRRLEVHVTSVNLKIDDQILIFEHKTGRLVQLVNEVLRL